MSASTEKSIEVGTEALRFHFPGGQINCHWRMLNPFVVPDRWHLRVKNFFSGVVAGVEHLWKDKHEVSI